jgi:hypothetical protein
MMCSRPTWNVSSFLWGSWRARGSVTTCCLPLAWVSGLYIRGGTTAIPKETTPFGSHAFVSHSSAEMYVNDVVSQRICPPSPRSRALILVWPVRVGFGGWPLNGGEIRQAVFTFFIGTSFLSVYQKMISRQFWYAPQ